MIEDDRAIFMFKDGSLAWESLDYLLEHNKSSFICKHQRKAGTKDGEDENDEKDDAFEAEKGGE